MININNDRKLDYALTSGICNITSQKVHNQITIVNSDEIVESIKRQILNVAEPIVRDFSDIVEYLSRPPRRRK